MSTLFPDEESLSPEMAWLRKHNLCVIHDPEGFIENEEATWMCFEDQEHSVHIGYGYNREEAMDDYANRADILPYYME
jgi:hypothetical protein